MKPVAPLILLFEKVIATYVQAVLALLLVHDTLGATTAQSAAIAAIPAALTVIANGMPGVPIGLPFWTDLVLRAGRTYVVSFVGLLVAMPMFHLNFTAAVAALSSALPSALAVVKAGIASQFGNTGTAALVPAQYDPGA